MTKKEILARLNNVHPSTNYHTLQVFKDALIFLVQQVPDPRRIEPYEKVRCFCGSNFVLPGCGGPVCGNCGEEFESGKVYPSLFRISKE